MRASIVSLSKKLISTFFAATLVMGLVPAAAFAANEDRSAEAPNNAESAEADSLDPVSDEPETNDSSGLVISSEVGEADTDEKSDPAPSVGAEPAPRDGEDATEDNAQASGGDNPAMSIPAATERINEDVMLTTPVAQQETTKNYFLAQTLESTRAVPIVTAQLPLDKGTIDVEVVEPNAEGEGADTSEEENGESPDDPDPDDLAATEGPADGVILTEASDSERSGEISAPVSAESTVIGSFTYLGMTFAIEPGGESVVLVAVDYSKLPQEFIEKQIIAIPESVTPDGIDYYSVTRIADHAFSSLTKENANEDYKGCIALFSDEDLLTEAGIDASEVESFLNSESDMIDIDGDGEADAPANPLKDCTGILAVGIPASVTSIGDDAFAGSDTLQYLVVSEDNSTYASYDGALYSADLTNLRLIPEGRVGAVRVAPSATDVSPEAFSHCPSVTALVADPESETAEMLMMDDFHDEGRGEIKTVLKQDKAGMEAPFLYAFFKQPVTLTTSTPSVLSVDERNVLFSSTSNFGYTISDVQHYCFNTTSDGSYSGGGDMTFPASTSYSWTANHSWNYSASYGLYAKQLAGNNKSHHAFYDYYNRYVYEIRVNDSTNKPASLDECKQGTTVHNIDTAKDKGIAAGGEIFRAGAGKTCYLWFGPVITWDTNGLSTSSAPGKTYVKLAPSLVNPVKPSATATNSSIWTLAGWYTASTGGTSVYSSDGTFFKNVGSTDSEKRKNVASITQYSATQSPYYIDPTYYARWQSNAIILDPNGGTINGSSAASSYQKLNNVIWKGALPTATTTGAFIVPQKTGYTFAGYWTAKEGGTQYYSYNASNNSISPVSGQTWTVDQDRLYAHYSLGTYTITLNGNGGTGGTGTVYLKYNTGWYTNSACTTALGNITAPTRTGYTYKGYVTTNNATSGSYWTAVGTKPSTTAFSANTTLYAVWTPNVYTITLNPWGGSGGTTEVYLKYNTGWYTTSACTTALGSITAPTLTGRTYAGYSTSTTATSGSYWTNVGTKPSTTAFSANTSLYAVWTPNVYTITLNSNGGTAGTTTVYEKYGVGWYTNSGCTTALGSITAPTKTGYSYAGYSTSNTATSGSYWTNVATKPGPAAFTSNGTLYAVWTPNVYTITFNGNGGSGGTTAVYEKYNTGWYTNSGCTTALGNITAPTRTGYTYAGFATSNTATSGSYWTNVATKPSTTAFSANTTLYAVWTPSVYTITLNANGGSGGTTAVYEKYSTGWYTTSGCTTALGNITAPTRTGYTYKGYSTDPNATSGTYWTAVGTKPATTAFSANTTLYAVWTANEYVITLDGNDGKISGTTTTLVLNNPKTPFASGNWNSVPIASRAGYTFNGYTATKNGTDYIYGSDGKCKNDGTYWKNSLWSYAGDKTFYAKWTAKTYTLTVNLNGGSISGDTKNLTYTMTYDQDWYSVLGWSNFGKTGHTFKGFWTDATGGTQVYGEDCKALANTIYFDANKKWKYADNLTVYAHWDPNKYNVTFDANGGAGGLNGQTKEVTFDSAMPALTGSWKPSLGGYEFNGWWDTSAKTGGNQYYTAAGASAQKWNKANNATLYARWSRVPFHAITLKDGRLDTDDQSIWYWPSHGFTPSNPNDYPVDGTRDNEIRIVKKSDANPNIVVPPTYADYEFLGYYDKPDGEGGTQKIDAKGNLLTDEVITTATTWYAHWKRLGSNVELKADYGEDMVAKDIVRGTDKIEHVAFEKDFATPLGEGTSRIEKIAQTPTRVGYTFMGYFTEPNPEHKTEVELKDYAGKLWINSDGTLVNEKWLSEEDWKKAPTNLVDKGAVTLYAAWQLDDCIVKFNTDTDDDTEPVVREEGALQDRVWHYNKNMSDTLPTPSNDAFSRNGYDFDGWYYLKDGKTETRICDKEGNPADVLLPWTDLVKEVTLYAYWTPRIYALAFDSAFPGDEGVEQIYTGEELIEGIKYDDSLTLVSPDFGAYDFAGWYVGVPDGMGGYVAGDVPFADWTLRDDTEVKGVHTTDVKEQDEGTYVGRFTPQDPLVGQTYDEASPEPAIIHVVAKWEDPVPHYIHFYAGLPEESLDESTRDYDPEYYKFAKTYPIEDTYLPNVGKDGWKCKGWVEAESEEEALQYLKEGYVGDERDPGTTTIEAKTTRAAYKDLYFVAKWTICPLSVTLVTTENEDGTYVKGTDNMLDADSWNAVPKTDSLYAKAYDVRQPAFTLPNLSRKGYDFQGWRLEGSSDAPKRDYPVSPAEQAKPGAQADLVFEPVFTEIEYTVYLEPNGGGLERQERKVGFTALFEFSGSYPVALHTGSVFKAWATKKQKPMEDLDGTYREFDVTAKVPMSCETEGMEDAPFFLTDLTTDEERTIYLYGIWFGEFYKVDVPLTVNMAIDTETGDVVAARTPLAVRSGNEDKVYTVESLRYEPVTDDEGRVPFEEASEVYFSIYPGLNFANSDDAYYFLQKSKVGEKGEVTYTATDGEKTATPLLIKLGAKGAPKLFTKTGSSSDPNEVTLDSMTTETTGFYSFSKDKPLDVYYGIHFGDPASWKSTLQKYAFGHNQGGWELPENDAGNTTIYDFPTDDYRRGLGWSTNRVDIAKVRYTLSMQTKAPE